MRQRQSPIPIHHQESQLRAQHCLCYHHSSYWWFHSEMKERHTKIKWSSQLVFLMVLLRLNRRKKGWWNNNHLLPVYIEQTNKTMSNFQSMYLYRLLHTYLHVLYLPNLSFHHHKKKEPTSKNKTLLEKVTCVKMIFPSFRDIHKWKWTTGKELFNFLS